MKFPKNIDTTGRVIRLIIAVILLVFAIVKMSLTLLFFACFVFFESFKSWCILYHLLGIKSCSIKKKP